MHFSNFYKALPVFLPKFSPKSLIADIVCVTQSSVVHTILLIEQVNIRDS